MALQDVFELAIEARDHAIGDKTISLESELMMKICIVSQIFFPQHEGGAEISSRHAAKNLSNHHDVVVLALGAFGSNVAPLGENYTDESYRLYRIPFRNSYLPDAKRKKVQFLAKSLWHMRNAWGSVSACDIRNFLISEKFDIIYAQNSALLQPALYNVAHSLNIPICQHLRDYALLCPRTSMFKNGKNCVTQCSTCLLSTARARMASNKVKSVVAVSEFVRQRFLSSGMFSNSKFNVLHNTNTSKADFSAQLLALRDPPTSQFTVGYIGSLSKEKGLEVLLDAFLSLSKDLPIRLLLAGQGDRAFTAILETRTRQLPAGRVTWLGHVRPEVVLQKADMLVVPSIWHEPQGRVIVEAATYGVPIVAALIGGIPEVVVGNRIGQCYKADDAFELASIFNEAASLGPMVYRTRIPFLFPGLSVFKGTAEESNYYERLEHILSQTAQM